MASDRPSSPDSAPDSGDAGPDSSPDSGPDSTPEPRAAKGRAPTARGLTRGQLTLAAVVAAAAVGGMVYASRHTRANLPSPVFHVDGRHAASQPLGLSLDLPAPWSSLDMPPERGLDFAYQHPVTRAVIIGYGLTPDKDKLDLDATLKEMLAEREKKWGSVTDVVWGNEALGSLAMRTLTFTLPREGGPVRNKIWTSLRGTYVVGFTCAGSEATFPMAEKSCRDVLDHLESEPGWRPSS